MDYQGQQNKPSRPALLQHTLKFSKCLFIYSLCNGLALSCSTGLPFKSYFSNQLCMYYLIFSWQLHLCWTKNIKPFFVISISIYPSWFKLILIDNLFEFFHVEYIYYWLWCVHSKNRIFLIPFNQNFLQTYITNLSKFLGSRIVYQNLSRIWSTLFISGRIWNPLLYIASHLIPSITKQQLSTTKSSQKVCSWMLTPISVSNIVFLIYQSVLLLFTSTDCSILLTFLKSGWYIGWV